MNAFKYWKIRFDKNDLLDFSKTSEGLLWLKLRSIDRTALLAEFCADIGYQPPQRITAELIWQDMSSKKTFGDALNTFMRKCQGRENKSIDASTDAIHSNLYKMTHFHWGGGFRNSLDKAIVSRYVKTDSIVPYDRLEMICDGELREMSRGYLLNSWYNYWSSVLIENLFKRNAGVLPAFGKIKNVDFFVDDFPFDLKVTYLPREYAALIRKRLGIDDPLRVLKAYARKHCIRFSPEDGPEQLRYEITEQMKDSSSSEAKSVLASIDGNWAQTVKCIMDDRRDLIRWLYENQGDMRFGAENRIFLVLIDMKNPDDSWKLKRNADLMSPMISRWVSNFKRNKAHYLLTEFSFKSHKYKTYADVIFVIKK